MCTFHKPAPKHEMREGKVSAPWTGMLYFVFCFCFISIIVHLNWQEREKKKICDVLLKKKFWKKNLRPKKKTIQFPILESTSGGTGSHSESKSLPFNCYILLLILVAITWFERIDLSSIASESFLTQKSKPSLISYFFVSFFGCYSIVLCFLSSFSMFFSWLLSIFIIPCCWCFILTKTIIIP